MNSQVNDAVECRPQGNHLTVFVVALILLALGVLCLFGPAILFSSGDGSSGASPGETEPALPGAEVIGILAVIFVFAAVGVISFILSGAFLLVGLCLSVSLVMKKKDEPRWLWIASLVLTVIFSLVLLGLALLFVFG